jgi:hypothetical protein
MTRTSLMLAAALFVLPAVAPAQAARTLGDAAPQDYRPAPVRTIGWAGGGLALALPVGEFSNYVQVGGGANGFVAWRLSADGAASIRVDGTFLIYGSETRRVPLAPSGPLALVNVDVTTSNLIASMGIGPQLTATHGAIRPYVSGEVGFSYFGTSSSVSGTHNVESFASSTNFDDFTFALRGGGGLWILLSSRRTPVSLDLSAHYIRNGRVSYLREGSITFDLTGAPIYHPIESETNLWLVQAGVSVGIQPRRR